MSSIVTPILLTVMMAFLVLGFAGFQQFQMTTVLSTRQAAQVASDRVRTQLQVQSANLATSVDLRLEVYNAGSISIADFKYMDLIVDYTATTGRVISRLTFTPGGTLPGQWRIAGIQPDILHPGLWNQGETVTIVANLPHPVKNGTTGTAIIGTPNGITAGTYFNR